MNPLKAVDPRIADRMMDELKARIAEAPGEYGPTPEDYGCTVLLTAQGNLYSEVYINAEQREAEERLLELLSQKGDTEVEYVLCLPLLAPACWMVKLLPELHPHNLETRILLPQEGDPRSRTIRECQPPKRQD